ncbi:UNVERIFIED_CONTAM: hypothetical protein B566_EDAN016668 [Ephemera danica]|nr:hypothetical protein B566_EDAN016668 [Ephemera danica]
MKKRRRSTELRGEIVHEVAVLEACAGCPRVVRLHQVFESDQEMILLLELAPGGELQMLLDQDEVPDERQVARLMRQIMDGVCYLHSINVAHLDIKPQNLVLTGEYPDCDVKLCDFGISRYISHGADIREILGTPDYVAPEVLNYEPISLATDMWSVGVLIYVLLTGCSPFGGDTKQETFCNISQCKLDFPDDLFDEISEEAKDLIGRLLVKDPSKRLSATQCLEHSWFCNPLPVAAKVATSITKVTTCVSEVVRSPTPILETMVPTKPLSPMITKKISTVLAKKPASPVQHRKITSPVLAKKPLQISSPILAKKPLQIPSIVDKKPVQISPVLDKKPMQISPVLDKKPLQIVSKKIESPVQARKITPISPVLSKKITPVSPVVAKSITPVKSLSVPPPLSVKPVSPVLSRTVLVKVESRTVPTPPMSLPPPLPSTPPPLPSTPPPSLNCKRNGIIPDRQTTFKKNMASLLQSLDSDTDSDKSNNNTISSTRGSQYYNSRVTTLPASYRRQLEQRSNLFTAVMQGNLVPRRSDESEAIYKFRRCFVDTDEEHIPSSLPHRIFMHSSGPSSTGSDSPYEHSSDTSSDTVSEMSIDSSSDRSSIISLDDSLDLAFSKRLYGEHSWLDGSFNVRLYRQQLVQQAKNSSSSNIRKQWPKECNGSFARAFSLFSEDPKNSDVTRSSGRKWKPVASRSVTTHCLMSSSTKGARKCSVELSREENGNLVVIREVENGKYSRFNEVKCESLQSRIRKLQVQGAQS